MSAQPAEQPFGRPDRPRSAAEIRRALPAGMRAEFDEALAAATLDTRAHVLALWSGIAMEAADPAGDDQVRNAIDGTLEAHSLEWYRREGAAG
ncbi:hypothetical protein GCM10010218_53050 [Streptomyces mashuensis]|uniref:Uncharacterized protein n=1 Tax=Streptomyces mashuensis TaxID=33904 RepID=A0A919B6U9_9ACTN|nr:hypothetical protein [Streptomyces mashuensis]GHF64984.1 hypothetical protein GCM10010218_53050 [Streptomyces mashuensis]